LEGNECLLTINVNQSNWFQICELADYFGKNSSKYYLNDLNFIDLARIIEFIVQKCDLFREAVGENFFQ
jgi:hypothetical protein